MSLLNLGRRNVTDLNGGYQAWSRFTQRQAITSARANDGRSIHRGVTALRVEDVIFLDDLRALGIPWLDRLVEPCTSREDVERVWTLIRMWGPDNEDVEDMLQPSAQVPLVERDVQKTIDMIRLCENYRR